MQLHKNKTLMMNDLLCVIPFKSKCASKQLHTHTHTRAHAHHLHSSSERRRRKKKEKKVGDAGYRSPYLSHAKRALYHLSYIPFWLSGCSSAPLYVLTCLCSAAPFPVYYQWKTALCRRPCKREHDGLAQQANERLRCGSLVSFFLFFFSLFLSFFYVA